VENNDQLSARIRLNDLIKLKLKNIILLLGYSKNMLTRLLTGVLFCIAAQTSAQIITKSSYVVKGTVFDAETMNPVEHVNIRDYNSNSSLSATDSTGSFEIVNFRIGSLLLFRHLFYRPQTVKSYDSIPMRVLLHPCCESISEAQEMFQEYCRYNLRYPVKLRRLEIGGEVLIRFSMDSVMNVHNVTMLKDIEGMYAETARQFILTLPVDVKKMLLYLNTTEFLLPIVFSFEKAAPPYTPPFATDVTVLKPVILVVYNSRAIH
jgi:hypothetical protein